MAIDLNLNEQQQHLQDTARGFFEKHTPPAVVRKYEDSEEEFPRSVWREMASLGWLAMTFPSEYDGLDLGFFDLYPLYIELGRSLAPAPHLDTVALGGELVARLGTDEQKKRILPAIASGDAILSLAVMEPEGAYGPGGVTLKARHEGAGYVLDGVKTLVGYARSANWLVVVARTGSGVGAAGVSLFLVDPKTAGVSIEATPNIGGYPLSAVTFSNVRLGADALLGPADDAWNPLNETMSRAAVLQAAMVLGAGDRVLDLSVLYANHRVQFGEPIGKYQAVQYLCTDIVIHSHVTKLLSLQAAWRIDSGRSFLREASLAKAAASKAAAAMTFAAHEVHAGVGFMLDYDLQLYTRRAKHWEWNLGDYRHHLDQAVAESGTPGTISMTQDVAARTRAKVPA